MCAAFDVTTDPRAPSVHKVVEPEEIQVSLKLPDLYLCVEVQVPLLVPGMLLLVPGMLPACTTGNCHLPLPRLHCIACHMTTATLRTLHPPVQDGRPLLAERLA